MTDANWKDDVSGLGSDPTKWDIGFVPNSTHYIYLPVWDGNLYTVTVDGSWTIGDLSTYANSTISLGGYTLTVNNGSYIRGTLDIRGGQFNNDGSGNLSMTSTSKIIGYGMVGQTLTGDDGEIRAQGNGQTLSVEFVSNNHNAATLIADAGATLYVRNTPSDFTVESYGVTDLNGGTLKGYEYYHYYQWVLDGTSTSHAKIEGHGIVDHYYIGAAEYAEINANDTNGTLTLNQGFVNATYNQTLSVSNNATFNVLQEGFTYWNFDGTGSMTGGSLTGDQFRQRGDMAYSGGTNTIGDAILYDNSIGTNTVSNNATLRTNGQVYLENATIAESGTGYFNVYGGTTEGRGNIYPDTTVTAGAYLKANDSGSTLAVHGTLTNQGVSLASDGGTLDLNGSVSNYGSLRASGGTVSVDAALTTYGGSTTFASSGSLMDINNTVVNGGSLYSASGGTMMVDGSTTNTGSIYSTGSGSALTLSSNVYNRNSIYADGSGTLNVTGTIKAGASETGDFSASGGTLNLTSATVETNVRNTFTASTGGTINLWSNPNTGNLYQTEALKPQGGTITITSGQTLTNTPGKSIRGYGTLLSDGRNLTNQGLIEASGGTFDVHGNITNTGTIQAASGYTLNVGSMLTNSTNGQIVANAGATVNLNSTDLTNNSAVYTTGSGALITVADTTPQGSGTFVACSGGTIRFAGGTTNENLSNSHSLQLAGGKITAAGIFTNAPGKALSGYGTLMDSEMALVNYGQILPQGGAISVLGNIENRNEISAGEGNGLSVAGSVTNIDAGTITNLGPGIISLGSLANDGLLQVFGGGGYQINGSVTGSGKVLLDQSVLHVRGSLMMNPTTRLDDAGTASSVNVNGNLVKAWDGVSVFHFEHGAMNLYSPAMTGIHQVDWHAQDLGAILSGLDDNLALGQLTLGDGVGLSGSDQFVTTGGSILYCYGLSIKSDADLDLGGSTIYYLRDGLIYNGIEGAGFENLGTWKNGQIIEIVPEPATICLLILGAWTAYRRRAR